MDVNSKEAELWSETMRLKSLVEHKDAETADLQMFNHALEKALVAECDTQRARIEQLRAQVEQLRIWKAASEQAFLDVLEALEANSTAAPVLEFIRAKLGVQS